MEGKPGGGEGSARGGRRLGRTTSTFREAVSWVAGWVIGRGKNGYKPYYVPAGHRAGGFQRILAPDVRHAGCREKQTP